MKSLFNPQTLDEYFDITGVDEEVRPKYRGWLENIFRGKKRIADTKYRNEHRTERRKSWLKSTRKYQQKIKALSDISDRIKKI